MPLVIFFLFGSALPANAMTIETFGAAPADVQPDRLFIQLSIGIIGGARNDDKIVTADDLDLVRSILRGDGIEPSAVVRSVLEKPQPPYDENTGIDRRAFGALLLKFENPTHIGQQHVETTIRRLLTSGPLRDGIYVERGFETFGLDDGAAARAKAGVTATIDARNAADRLAKSISPDANVSVAESPADFDSPTSRT